MADREGQGEAEFGQGGQGADPLDRALATAIDAAQRAGELLRGERWREGGPRGLGSHADADDEAEAIIRSALTAAFPTWGYRGEETGTVAAAPGCPYLWLVDPNDGTASYLRGWRGTAVSIGLLRAGVPVLGVVFAYAWPDDAGDLIAWADGHGPLQRNGVAVAQPAWAPADPSTVVALSQDADAIADQNSALVAPSRYVAVPSVAWRLALAAVGDVAAGVSLGHPTGWDLCGAHALLRGAGGEVYGGDGRPITYSASGDVIGDTSAVCGGGPVARALSGKRWQSLRFSKFRADALDLALPRPGEGVADPAVLARAHGCWFGQIAGDSLGSLVEFQTAGQIARRYPGGPERLADGGTFGTLAGQPTDDSELALALARSLVCDPAGDLEATARAYRAWIESAPFDIGTTTRIALGAIREHHVDAGAAAAAATQAASRTSQANGALMRVAPIGLWGVYRADADIAARARADAALTHPHPVCQDSSALWSLLIARAVRRRHEPGELYAAAREIAQAMQPALRAVVDAAASAPPAEFQHQMGWVLIAVHNALFHLAQATPFAAALRATVAAGGDTDTNGAIAGALLGAVYGRDAVPAQWRLMVWSCRPLPSTHQPRPRWLWPVDAPLLAERLTASGRSPLRGC